LYYVAVAAGAAAVVGETILYAAAEILYHHVTTSHMVDLKPQNRLQVGTDKPKPKVKMQSV